MKRLAPLCVGLGLLWSGLSAAAPLAPLEFPAPDLVPLLPLAALPRDKSPVSLPELPLPEPREPIPALPPSPLVVDLSQKPLAPLRLPRLLACNPLGSVFGVASELLECGRARFQRGELEEARVALEDAVRSSSDRALIREARYWLGETLFLLNRLEEAERTLRRVHQDGPANELGLHAVHSLGWVALRLNDPSRALQSFQQALSQRTPPEVAGYASHGRALALYALGRYAEAREAWQALATHPPPPLVREMRFWLGESLGRVGEPAAAEEQLRRFTDGGPHPLLETGILRLGWWALAAGHHLDSVKAFRWLLSAYPRAVESAWARVGLVRALLALDDFAGAREEAHRIQAQDPGHPLVIPSLLLLLHASVEKDRRALARTFWQELLELNLSPAVRSYVLLLGGEVSRREGQGGQARTQFELVGSLQPGSPSAWRATLRLVQLDLETREFTRALDKLGNLLREPLPPGLRSAALLLRGEVAYRGNAYGTAADAFGRFVAEFPDHPEVPSAVLSLGWVELRRERPEGARQRWLDFARSYPHDPRLAGVLLLMAELAARAGDMETAKNLLDQMLADFPAHPDVLVARLNRAILELRAGRVQEGLRRLRALLPGASSSPFIGRMRLATGIALLAAGSPGEAEAELSEALKQGEDILAHLGLGSAALAQGQWRKAERHFDEARDFGSGPARRLAEYGAAAAAFHEGKRAEFSRAAAAVMQAPLSAPLAPRLAYVLAAVAGEEKRWDEARQWTLRLVNDFPQDPAADDALARLGASAFRAREWPLVRESYQLLMTRYPQSPHAEESRVDLAEALVRTGAHSEARGLLAPLMAASDDARLPRALLLMAEAQEATGNRSEAIEALARLVRDYPDSDLAGPAQMIRGRLLQEAGRWQESRQVWEGVLSDGEAGAQVEAGFRLGEAYRAEGLHAEAVEAYMTAAYLAPETSWGRRALLRAGQSFAALKDPDSAAVVYRKLLAQPGVEPELAREAKKALEALGQRS